MNYLIRLLKGILIGSFCGYVISFLCKIYQEQLFKSGGVVLARELVFYKSIGYVIAVLILYLYMTATAETDN